MLLSGILMVDASVCYLCISCSDRCNAALHLCDKPMIWYDCGEKDVCIQRILLDVTHGMQDVNMHMQLVFDHAIGNG